MSAGTVKILGANTLCIKEILKGLSWLKLTFNADIFIVSAVVLTDGQV